VQDVPSVPPFAEQADGDAEPGRGGEHRGAIGARQGALADDDRRTPGGLERLGEVRVAIDEAGDDRWALAEVVVAVGEVGALADHADARLPGQPQLAQAGVEHRRLEARLVPIRRMASASSIPRGCC